MESKRFDDAGEYVYSRLPENIRQIGEMTGKVGIYIEDYVMTYIRQVFMEKQENAIVLLLGKIGRKAAEGCKFIYGAIAVECDMQEGIKEFTTEKWNEIYHDMNENFPGAQILGWGCGVIMWNSRIDAAVRQIHSKYFNENGKILFLSDLSEKEEKLFICENGELTEQPGFIVYYEKNPQMQEYMLKGQPKESFESSYKDDVTANVRQLIKSKGVKRNIQTKHIAYAIGAAMAIMLLIGVNLLMESMDKIKSLEESLNNVVGYIDSRQAETVMSDNAKEFLEEPEATKRNSKKDTLKPTSNVDSKADSSSQNTLLPKDTFSQNSDVSEDTSEKNTKNNSDTIKNSNSQTGKSDTKTDSTSGNTNDTSDNAADVSAYNGSYQSYIVNAGDTLSQIVWDQYHSFYYLDKVMKANNIKDCDKIYEGDCIILPDFINK